MSTLWGSNRKNSWSQFSIPRVGIPCSAQVGLFVFIQVFHRIRSGSGNNWSNQEKKETTKITNPELFMHIHFIQNPPNCSEQRKLGFKFQIPLLKHISWAWRRTSGGSFGEDQCSANLKIPPAVSPVCLEVQNWSARAQGRQLGSGAGSVAGNVIREEMAFIRLSISLGSGWKSSHGAGQEEQSLQGTVGSLKALGWSWLLIKGWNSTQKLFSSHWGGAFLAAKLWSWFPTGTRDKSQVPRPSRATLNGFEPGFQTFPFCLVSSITSQIHESHVDLRTGSKREKPFLHYLDARSCCYLSAISRIKSFRIIPSQEIPARSQMQSLSHGNGCHVEMRWWHSTPSMWGIQTITQVILSIGETREAKAAGRGILLVHNPYSNKKTFLKEESWFHRDKLISWQIRMQMYNYILIFFFFFLAFFHLPKSSTSAVIPAWATPSRCHNPISLHRTGFSTTPFPSPHSKYLD